MLPDTHRHVRRSLYRLYPIRPKYLTTNQRQTNRHRKRPLDPRRSLNRLGGPERGADRGRLSRRLDLRSGSSVRCRGRTAGGDSEEEEGAGSAERAALEFDGDVVATGPVRGGGR